MTITPRSQRRETQLKENTRQQVTTSNSTLNKFLGGRGPAWLTGEATGDSPPRRHTFPRRSSNPQPLPTPGEDEVREEISVQERDKTPEDTQARNVSSTTRTASLQPSELPAMTSPRVAGPYLFSPGLTPYIPSEDTTVQDPLDALDHVVLAGQGTKRKETGAQTRNEPPKRMQTVFAPFPPGNVIHSTSPTPPPGYMRHYEGVPRQGHVRPSAQDNIQPNARPQTYPHRAPPTDPPMGFWVNGVLMPSQGHSQGQSSQRRVPLHHPQQLQQVRVPPHMLQSLPSQHSPYTPAQLHALQQITANATVGSPNTQSPQQYPSPVSQNGCAASSPQIAQGGFAAANVVPGPTPQTRRPSQAAVQSSNGGQSGAQISTVRDAIMSSTGGPVNANSPIANPPQLQQQLPPNEPLPQNQQGEIANATPHNMNPAMQNPKSMPVIEQNGPRPQQGVTTPPDIIPGKIYSQLQPMSLPYNQSICTPQLDNYRRMRGEITALPPLNNLEQTRFTVLASAADSEDSFFLFLHQVMSLRARGTHLLPKRIREIPHFERAAAVLDGLLASNRVQDDHLLVFFSEMPQPLPMITMDYPTTYQKCLNFLDILAQSFDPSRFGWTNLKQVCFARRIPPLATELWDQGIITPVLMDIFFQFSLRSVWHKMEHLHERAKRIHEDNRAALYTDAGQQMLHPVRRQSMDQYFYERFERLLYDDLSTAGNGAAAGTANSSALTNVARSPAADLDGIDSGPALHNPQRRSRQQVQLSTPGQPLSPNHMGRHPSSSLRQPIPQQPTPTLALAPPEPRGRGRPRGGRNQAMPNRPNQVLLASKPQVSDAFMPAAGAEAPGQTVTPTWELSALHQAHLRPPLYGIPNEIVRIDQAALLYQVIEEIKVGPCKLGTAIMQRHSFVVSAEQDAFRARTSHTEDEGPKQREILEGSQQYRLRMVKLGPVTDKDWTVEHTSFPLHIYLMLNGKSLEIRRKQHFTKDLPIDLTEYIVQGTNALDIFLNVAPGDTEMDKYAFAIEVVGARRHDRIIEDCLTRIVPKDEVLSSIVKSLNYTGSDDDDLIIDVSSAKITIQIFDPILQGGICTLPARGRSCKHRECFDLHSFLRGRERDQPSWPTHVDVWKCPVCGEQDVRPQNVVIDGFMLEVREKLLKEGKGDVRAIVVGADGSWVPKVEKVDKRERSTERGGKSEASTPKMGQPAPVVGESNQTLENGTPSLETAAAVAALAARSMVAAGKMAGAREMAAGGREPRRAPVVIDITEDSD